MNSRRICRLQVAIKPQVQLHPIQFLRTLRAVFSFTPYAQQALVTLQTLSLRTNTPRTDARANLLGVPVPSNALQLSW